MPFTPTHIIAVLPFAWLVRGLMFSALVIGCMVPDLPLFVPIIPYAQTHSALGVLTTCLPLGIATFVIFQLLLKVPLIALCPVWYQCRIASYSEPILESTFRFWAKACMAVAIGSFTHVFWDSFTHERRWGTQIVPMLNSNVAILGREFAVYKLFQYGSTLFGLPVLMATYFAILSKTNPTTEIRPRDIGVAVKLFVYGCCLMIPLILVAIEIRPAAPLTQVVGKMIKTYGNATAVILFVYSLLFHILTRSRHIV